MNRLYYFFLTIMGVFAIYSCMDRAVKPYDDMYLQTRDIETPPDPDDFVPFCITNPYYMAHDQYDTLTQGKGTYNHGNSDDSIIVVTLDSIYIGEIGNDIDTVYVNRDVINVETNSTVSQAIVAQEVWKAYEAWLDDNYYSTTRANVWCGKSTYGKLKYQSEVTIQSPAIVSPWSNNPMIYFELVFDIAYDFHGGGVYHTSLKVTSSDTITFNGWTWYGFGLLANTVNGSDIRQGARHDGITHTPPSGEYIEKLTLKSIATNGSVETYNKVLANHGSWDYEKICDTIQHYLQEKYLSEHGECLDVCVSFKGDTIQTDPEDMMRIAVWAGLQDPLIEAGYPEGWSITFEVMDSDQGITTRSTNALSDGAKTNLPCSAICGSGQTGAVADSYDYDATCQTPL